MFNISYLICGCSTFPLNDTYDSSLIMNLYEALNVLLVYQKFNGITFSAVGVNHRLAVTLTSQIVPLLYFTLCWSVTIVFGVFFNKIQPPANIQDAVSTSGLAFYALMISNILQTIIYTITFILAWNKRCDEVEIYDRLYEIDVKLETFGIDLDYARLRSIANYLVLGVICLVWLIIPGLCCGYIYISVERLSLSVNLIFLVLQMNSLCAMTVAYCFVVFLLKQRLLAFRGYIQKPGRVDAMPRVEFDEVLRTYRQMRQVIKTINNVHGMKQLFNILSDFTVVTHELYFTLEIMRKVENVTSLDFFTAFICIAWSCIHVVKMVVTCFLTHTTVAEVIVKFMTAIVLLDYIFEHTGSRHVTNFENDDLSER
jgi:7tm Chemosensory receptor